MASAKLCIGPSLHRIRGILSVELTKPKACAPDFSDNPAMPGTRALNSTSDIMMWEPRRTLLNVAHPASLIAALASRRLGLQSLYT